MDLQNIRMGNCCNTETKGQIRYVYHGTWWSANGYPKSLRIFDRNYNIRREFKWFETGMLSHEMHVSDCLGKIRYVTYYENGQQKAEWGARQYSLCQSCLENPRDIPVYDDLHDGPYRLWHENGTLVEEGEYFAGRQTGTIRHWKDDGTACPDTVAYWSP